MPAVSNPGAIAHTSTAFPLLPIEVWETIIDHMCDYGRYVSYPEVRQPLAACMLVCKSWGPRCRRYLLGSVKLKNRSQLDTLVEQLLRAPWLCDFVENLYLSPIPGSLIDHSLVCLAPLHLPPLKNLKCVQIDGFDFSLRLPNFYWAYRQFHLDKLYLYDFTYTRFSEVTQLAVATRAIELYAHGTARTRSAGTGALSFGMHAHEVGYTMDWKSLAAASETWHRHSSPFYFELRLLRVSASDDDAAFGRDTATWARIASVFRGHLDEPDDSVTIVIRAEGSYGGFDELCTISTEHGEGNSLVVRFNGMGNLFIVPYALRGISQSRSKVHTVELPAAYSAKYGPTDVETWSAIDEALAHPHFSTLPVCDIYFDRTSEYHRYLGHDIGDYGCLHEVYREWLPRTASRGLLACTVNTCMFRNPISVCVFPISVALFVLISNYMQH
ncbi:hypothetical protein BXZ70DRAFT_1010598 [Cristinia sonorae]|uniref:F-box domain-containing protein n=1 Tax=Cristinia sonorae TaxID=1940300 RepID=A0A8K0UJE0_9AGAR|nr:hypothetical protein BXZ70DRAFT_1010598 [Cristinia sonorae]